MDLQSAMPHSLTIFQKKKIFLFLMYIFGTYRKRVAEVNDMINQLLKQPYTFTEDETII